MTKLMGQQYSLTFTEESVQAANTEREARGQIRATDYAHFNDCVRKLNSNVARIPTDLQATISEIISLTQDIDHESYMSGFIEAYLYIISSLPEHLPHILLTIFKRLKVPMTKKRIDDASAFAVFQILREERSQGKEQQDIAKYWGRSNAYWTRVKQSDYAKRMERFLKHIMNHKKMRGGEADESEDQQDHTTGENSGPFCEYEDTGLRTFSERERRSGELNERSQDWEIAVKLASESLEQAVDFLTRQGCSKANIRKFRAQMGH